MNYEFERESGFINSQPSLAECLTSFPPVADSFQSSSIKSSTLSRPTLIPPPFEQTIPSLNPGSHPRHGRPRHSPDGCSPLPTASLPPEYPWMREKKASKRNHLPNSTTTTISNGPVCFSPKGGWFKTCLLAVATARTPTGAFLWKTGLLFGYRLIGFIWLCFRGKWVKVWLKFGDEKWFIPLAVARFSRVTVMKSDGVPLPRRAAGAFISIPHWPLLLLWRTGLTSCLRWLCY